MAEDYTQPVANKPVNTASAPSEGVLDDTHWVHLADGRVITTKGSLSSYDGVPVIGVYAMPESISTEPEHKF